jgi:hypothetical protein
MRLSAFIPSFALLLFLALNLKAQDNTFKEDTKLLYKYESTFGITAHSRGWGFSYRKAKNLTAFTKLVYEGEFATQRHPKEIRTRTSYKENAKSFVYGKQYALVSLRPGIGMQKILYGKENPGAVEIRYGYYGGISLGVAKPVYLVVAEPSAIPNLFKQEVERYDPEKHEFDNIIERAPFGRGLSSTKIYPGFYGKVAVTFEYSPEDETAKAIETGLVIDVYPKPVPQMAFNKNYPWLFSFYVTFMFGDKE